MALRVAQDFAVASKVCPILLCTLQGAKFVNAFKAKSHLLTMGDSDEDKLLVMQVCFTFR